MPEYVYCAVNTLNEIQWVKGSSSKTRYFKTNKYLAQAVEYHNKYYSEDPWRIVKFKLVDVTSADSHEGALEQLREKYEKLHEDMCECGPCSVCAYAPRELCDPDADYESDAFKRWRGCRGKSCFKWRYEDDKG